MDDWTETSYNKNVMETARLSLPGLLHQADAVADKATLLAASLRTQANKLRAAAGVLYQGTLPRPGPPWPTVTATLTPAEFDHLTTLLDTMQRLWPGESIDAAIDNLMAYAIRSLHGLDDESISRAMDMMAEDDDEDMMAKDDDEEFPA